MPTKKTPNPPKKSSPVTPSAPGPVSPTPDLAQLLVRWPMVPTQAQSLDARAAASFVLSQAMPLLSDKTLQARFASLPKTEWKPQSLTDLPLAAQAVLAAATDLASVTARTDATRLPVDLLTESSACKSRMMKVLDYLLGEQEEIARELSAIRQGQGYLDLAQDLAQLGKLYGSERAQLQKDNHLYQQSDEKLASTLSQRIFSELRQEQPVAERERLTQAASLLVFLYDEVAATARWLLRNTPEEASRSFPSLFRAARRPRKRTDSPSPAEPPHPQ